MENNAFEEYLHRFLEKEPDIFCALPAGSRLWSLSPLNEQEWIPHFVSARAGRWNLDGDPVKYFADNLPTCLAEMAGQDEEIKGFICEHWITTAPLRCLDVQMFPLILQQAMFESGGLPVERWAKTHLFLKRLKLFPEYHAVTAIKAPSAYGCALEIPGYTLATNPRAQPLQFSHKTTIGEYRSFS